jgi:hypothetical protein
MRIARWLAPCAPVAALVWAAWPGRASGPATLISGADALVTLCLLAMVPRLVARRFGPCGSSRLARFMRLAGSAAVLALIIVKTHVERSEFAGMSGTLRLAGFWAGEAIFLGLMAAYSAGLFAVTARRPPASPAALAVGTGAGALAGVVMYALPPGGTWLNLSGGWLDAYVVARVLAVPLVLAAAVMAGVKAARRTGRRTRRTKAETLARQGLAAGACAGVAAALIVSILGMTTIAFVPHDASIFEWTLPVQHIQPGSFYAFEVSVSEAAAGYLLVLLFFPLLGAGLGAWGGLYGSERPGNQPGGGGGGGRGPWRPRLGPPPPGGRKLEGPAGIDVGRLLSMPEWNPAASPVREQPARPEREPVRPASDGRRLPAG